MRLFVALLFDNGFRASLAGMMRSLRRAGVTGGFTPPENLHLTLAFIGETNRVDEAKAAISSLDLSPVELELDCLGRFGDTVWAGLRPNMELNAAADAVGKALWTAGAGFKLEKRPFIPHITLVRRAKPDELPHIEIPAAAMTARRVSLMSSQLGKGRPVYTEIFSREMR
jgi:2'-5' RNA ligase